MLDRTGPRPLHVQLEEIIRQKISGGEWASGQMIPSENELSRMYDVSRMTIRNVITKLVLEGMFERIPGKGTFVTAQKIVASPLSYAGIREQLERMGYEVSTQLLSIEQQRADAKCAKLFAMHADSLFYVVRRLRYVRGVPLSIHTSYIPALLCPDLDSHDIVGEQLCVVLNKSYGLVPSKTAETLESVGATREEAELLHIRYGHPLLLLEDVISNENGMVFEYAKVAFRGDKLKVHLSF